MKKLLVTGSNGQLGRDLIDYLSGKYEVSGFDIDQINICEIDQIRNFFDQKQPDIVLHTAAYTNVDLCESNIDAAMAVNAKGSENIARCCLEIGSQLVYYSTDYVFDGKKKTAYIETDEPNPLTIYGKSKLEGEKRIESILENYIILRIAWVYGRFGKNFVKTMLKLGQMQLAKIKSGQEITPISVVNDQLGNPTWTVEIARQTGELLENKYSGIFHGTSEGVGSWYDFAVEIFDQIKMDIKLSPCTTEQFPRPAPRPANSALENRRLKQHGINKMVDYKSALKKFLLQYGEELKK